MGDRTDVGRERGGRGQKERVLSVVATQAFFGQFPPSGTGGVICGHTAYCFLARMDGIRPRKQNALKIHEGGVRTQIQRTLFFSNKVTFVQLDV